MSSTISTGRRVGAIRSASDQIYYALFECTYESNVFPQDPTWGCVGFYDAYQAIKEIFFLAGATYGGLLKRPGGRFTPQGYVSTWLSEMKNPFRLRDTSITFQVKEGMFSGGGDITRDALAGTLDRLRASNMSRVADILEKEECYHMDSLAEEADILSVILNKRAPYRLLHESMLDKTERHPDLGWAPKKAANPPQYDLPGKYRINQGDENVLVEQADGRLGFGGWTYAVMNAFISGYAELEWASPGYYRSAFKAVENHLENLPQLPEDTLIKIEDTRRTSGFGYVIDKLLDDFGSTRGYLKQIPQDERHLMSYVDKQLTFELPTHGKSPVESPNQLSFEF